MSSKKKNVVEKKVVAVKVPKAPSVRKPAKPLAERLVAKSAKLASDVCRLADVLTSLAYDGAGDVRRIAVDIAARDAALTVAIASGDFFPVVTRGRHDRNFKTGDKVQVKEKYAHNGQISLDPMTVVQVIGSGKDISLSVEDKDGNKLILPRAKFERVK